MQTAFTVDKLCKRFGPVQAVNNLCLRVPAGTCYGLLGPNGAGKTTTLELLEGLQKPDSGRIEYNGHPMPPGTRPYEQIGIQLQATALPDNLTVANTLALFRALYESPMAVEQLVDLCQLAPFLQRRTSQLSGGQRQRVLLALALVNDPPLVFLDEPTSGLDPQARQHVWLLIQRVLEQGKTVLLTTHYMEEAEALCARVGIMDHGELIAEGSPDELIRQHCPAASVQLTGTRWPDALLQRWGGTVQSEVWTVQTQHTALFLQDLLASGVGLERLTVNSPNLNDVFLKLTGSALRA